MLTAPTPGPGETVGGQRGEHLSVVSCLDLLDFLHFGLSV